MWTELTTTQLLIGAAIAIGAGFLMLVGCLLGLIYLPAKYLAPRRQRARGQRSIAGRAWLVGKNLLGVAMIAAGVLMLVLPGPGIAAIALGLLLVSFPGKRALVTWLLQKSGSIPTINRWRASCGQPPLPLTT